MLPDINEHSTPDEPNIPEGHHSFMDGFDSVTNSYNKLKDSMVAQVNEDNEEYE